jgi:hypothetical protein
VSLCLELCHLSEFFFFFTFFPPLATSNRVMKRGTEQFVCRIFDSMSHDCFGALPGLDVSFDGVSGSFTPLVDGKWEVLQQIEKKQQKKVFAFLLAHSEYELEDGLVLRLDKKKEYKVSIAPYVGDVQGGAKKLATKQSASKSVALKPCQLSIVILCLFRS